MIVRKGWAQVRNGCCCGSAQNSRTRLMGSADLLPVEVEEQVVGLHLHWMRLESSLSRLDLVVLEHEMESLLRVSTVMG